MRVRLTILDHRSRREETFKEALEQFNRWLDLYEAGGVGPLDPLQDLGATLLLDTLYNGEHADIDVAKDYPKIDEYYGVFER